MGKCLAVGSGTARLAACRPMAYSRGPSRQKSTGVLFRRMYPSSKFQGVPVSRSLVKPWWGGPVSSTGKQIIALVILNKQAEKMCWVHLSKTHTCQTPTKAGSALALSLALAAT
jgi:hypothetical protein